MAISEFYGEKHTEFQTWRQEHPDGFFLNCTPGRWMFHRTGCAHSGSVDWLGNDNSTLTRVRKACSSTLQDLRNWAKANSESVVSCSDCRPNDVPAEKLIAFAQGLARQPMATAAEGKPFRVRLRKNGLEFVPLSSGTPRFVSREIIDNVCEVFGQTGSTRPRDYQRRTHDASYLLTLIEKCVGIRRAYLFLWNPAQDTESFQHFDQVQQDAAAGKPYLERWICRSNRPRPGDIAIIQRTGRSNNGVFGRGTIVSECEPDDDGTPRISIELDQFLPLGSELSRSRLIEQCGYASAWAPQATGTLIPDEIVQAISFLWQRPSNPETVEDLPAPPGRVNCNTRRIIRDTRLVCDLKIKYAFTCQVCRAQLPTFDGQYYIEGHHLRPLGGRHRGLDVAGNVLILCPNHHALFDLGIPRFLSQTSVEVSRVRYDLLLKHPLDAQNVAYYMKEIHRSQNGERIVWLAILPSRSKPSVLLQRETSIAPVPGTCRGALGTWPWIYLRV